MTKEEYPSAWTSGRQKFMGRFGRLCANGSLVSVTLGGLSKRRIMEEKDLVGSQIQRFSSGTVFLLL